MHRAITVALALAAAVAIGVVVVDVLLRPQAGPLALAAVIEEHLLLVGLVAGLALGLVTVGRGRANAIGRLLAVVVLVLAIVRLGSEWWSSPGTATSESRAIRVLSWNLELGSKAAQSSVAGIASGDADLVALQELTPDVAAAIEADAALKARYPYRILAPDDGVRGMGLLSRLPLTATPDTSPGLGSKGHRSCMPGCSCPTVGASTSWTSIHSRRRSPAWPASRLAWTRGIAMQTWRRSGRWSTGWPIRPRPSSSAISTRRPSRQATARSSGEDSSTPTKQPGRARASRGGRARSSGSARASYGLIT